MLDSQEEVELYIFEDGDKWKVDDGLPTGSLALTRIIFDMSSRTRLDSQIYD